MSPPSIPIPPTHRAVRRGGTGPGTSASPLPLRTTTEATPAAPGGGALPPRSVLVRVRAVSLNYRDALLLRGAYPGPNPALPGGVVASDCAGEVVAAGEGVTRVAVGDRVAVAFNWESLTGEEGTGRQTTVGAEVDGVLREWAVWGEEVVVRLPGHLSWEEGATIGCAGLTAWSALGAPGSLDKNKTVLIQGTGGVSMFALLIALAGGLKPIITSSSDEKLEALRKKLGVPDLLGYNYRTNPDQVAEVMRLTGGRGVDIVVNNTGPAGIPADIDSLAPANGTISIVGFLGGLSADWNPTKLLALVGKTARLQGVAAGSRAQFEEMNKFLEERQVRLSPLVDDKVFDFDHAQEAFDYLWSGKHVGKVVIRV